MARAGTESVEPARRGLNLKTGGGPKRKIRQGISYGCSGGNGKPPRRLSRVGPGNGREHLRMGRSRATAIGRRGEGSGTKQGEETGVESEERALNKLLGLGSTEKANRSSRDSRSEREGSLFVKGGVTIERAPDGLHEA